MKKRFILNCFNVLPHVDSFDSNGNTKEELKLLNESKKILHNESLKVNCTCVRVPVLRRTQSLTASFENPLILGERDKRLVTFQTWN